MTIGLKLAEKRHFKKLDNNRQTDRQTDGQPLAFLMSDPN